MKNILLIAFMLASSHVMAEDTEELAASPDADKIEVYKLHDGSTVVGVYDEKTHILNTCNRTTGKRTGIRGMDPSEIVSHKALLVKPKVVVASKAAADLPGTQGDWIDNYDTAVASAVATSRPIVIDFTGSDWCPWCIKLHDEILSTKDFKEWATANVVLLMADFPNQIQQSDELKKQNSDLQAKYSVGGYPTIIVIDSTGKNLGQSGYKALEPKAWIADLKQCAHLP